MRFIEFLLNEQVNVTLDPEDPAGSLAKAKDQLKTAMRDPSRAVRQRQQNLKDRDEDIEKEEDPNIAKARMDIQTDEERVAKKRMQLTQFQKQKAADAERQQRTI